MNRDQDTTGYVRLLRENRDFRKLWTGLLISQTGDWFNSVALFTLMLNLTGSGEAVGFILILKLLPQFFVSPLAGVVADRFNRKAILIMSDILRGLLVLGFLFIDRPDQVWLVYLLTALQVVATSFFEPAHSAIIPNIVERNSLIAANALASASWSVTLALGAALGGLVTDALGRDTAFVIDSATFFMSAAFVWFVRVPKLSTTGDAEPRSLSLAEATGIRDLIDGARYLKANPRVTALLMVKSGWGLGGGVLLLLTVFGKQIFPVGRDGSTSIGLLYAARGLGALLGPVIARQMTRSSVQAMRRAIGYAFLVSTLFYLLFAYAPTLWAAALFAIGAHAGGSIQWVFSATLLQLTVDNRFMGRVFALEMALLTLAVSLSVYLTGWGLDHVGIAPRTMAMILGITFLFPGALWFIVHRRLSRSEASLPAEALSATNPESR